MNQIAIENVLKNLRQRANDYHAKGENLMAQCDIDLALDMFLLEAAITVAANELEAAMKTEEIQEPPIIITQKPQSLIDRNISGLE